MGSGPHYFDTVGTRLRSGRAFSERDTHASPRVFIINHAMASGLFGDESPLGRRLAQAGSKNVEWGEIVGVFSARRVNEVAVRTAGAAPSTLVDSIRTAMASLDPELPVLRLQPAEMTISRAYYQQGVLSTMLSSLALLGLALASLGIYGVITRTTAQRAGEFGIRLALGARAGDVTRLVLASGMKLALIGSAVGLVGAIGVSRLLASGFTAIHTDHAATLLGATAFLIGIAVLFWLPARRAARVDPMVALRAE